MGGVTPGLWVAATVPVLVLFAAALSRRASPRTGAALALCAALLCAVAVFGATPPGLAVAAGKGLWLGLWILFVVWPALLLYRVVAAVGFTRIGEALSDLLPGRCERLLAVAWLFPAFVQGVAGFGTPIAVAAPLLVAMGWSRARSVALPLVGYHWSVTFGSMGSSFYVASLTAGLGPAGQAALALHAGLFLGLNCLASGVLVLVMDGGWRRLREGLPLLLRLGPPTAVTLVGVAAVVPAVASLMAGTVGLGLLWLVSSRRPARRPPAAGTAVAVRAVGTTAAAAGRLGTVAGVRGADGPGGVDASCGADGAADGAADGDTAGGGPVRGDLVGGASTGGASTGGGPAGGTLRAGAQGDRRPATLLLLCPYAFLLLTALPVFLVPQSRQWVHGHWLVGPGFPATRTHRGFVAAAVDTFDPLATFGHPGGYILLAAGLGYLAYRRAGLLDPGGGTGILDAWLRGLPAASAVVLILTTVATVMADAGMVSVLARGTESATGRAFPVLAPLLGAVGSFTTGSTASSNALLAAFQAQVAHLLGADPAVFVAAQTAGSNVGNLLSPVIVLVGLSAVGAPEQVPVVLRACLRPAAVLLTVVVASVLVSVR